VYYIVMNKMTGPSIKEKLIRTAACTAVAGVALAGCAKGESPPTATSQPETATASTLPEGLTTTARRVRAVLPFEVEHDWSNLPHHINLDPPFKTESSCLNDAWWEDKDGHRAPLVQSEPMAVTIDGRCNEPVNSDIVGVYPQPEQTPGTASVKAVNGDVYGVECRKEPGQFIQDVRGPIHGSNVWVGIVNAAGQGGFVPIVNIGLPDMSGVRPC
jgi:hypothetical protein